MSAIERRNYILKEAVIINNMRIDQVIIDPHVDKHSEHITDDLILDLIALLDNKNYVPTMQKGDFSYYLSKVLFNERIYRLVWLLEEGCFYVGVITAFKEKGAKRYDIP